MWNDGDRKIFASWKKRKSADMVTSSLSGFLSPATRDPLNLRLPASTSNCSTGKLSIATSQAVVSYR